MSTFRRRLMMAGKKGLPYDAEIEYIGTTGVNGTDGTQIIDTGVKASNKIQFDFDIATDYANGRFIFGAGTRTNTNALTIFNKYESGATDNGIRYDFRNFTGFIPTKNVQLIDLNTRVNFNNRTYVYRLNYESKYVNVTNGTFTTSLNILMFGRTQNSSTIQYAKGCMKCYYLKLWNDGVLVRDMIPVRVGTVGYMYDKVTKALFGNAGTGDFVLGNDIT